MPWARESGWYWRRATMSAEQAEGEVHEPGGAAVLSGPGAGGASRRPAALDPRAERRGDVRAAPGARRGDRGAAGAEAVGPQRVRGAGPQWLPAALRGLRQREGGGHTAG